MLEKAPVLLHKNDDWVVGNNSWLSLIKAAFLENVFEAAQFFMLSRSAHLMQEKLQIQTDETLHMEIKLLSNPSPFVAYFTWCPFLHINSSDFDLFRETQHGQADCNDFWLTWHPCVHIFYNLYIV